MLDTLLEGDVCQPAAQLHSLDRPTTSAGFPTHLLIVGVRRDRQVGVLSSMDGNCRESNVVSVGNLELGQGPVYYSLNGEGNDFPLSSEIPIGKVREAVKEFVASGGMRPTCIEWGEAGTW
ncbi:hypothetical protein G6W52_25070 [Streptomyces sp. CAI-155]|nr:hypothetical protein [Streptomyces sp. CAI-155]